MIPAGYKVVTMEAAPPVPPSNPAKTATLATKGVEKIQGKIDKEEEKQASVQALKDKMTNDRIKALESQLAQATGQKPGEIKKPAVTQAPPKLPPQQQMQFNVKSDPVKAGKAMDLIRQALLPKSAPR